MKRRVTKREGETETETGRAREREWDSGGGKKEVFHSQIYSPNGYDGQG